MAVSEFAERYCAKMAGGKQSFLSDLDAEFADFFKNFAFDEVVNADDLDDKTRFLAVLATLLGCQGVDMFKEMLSASFEFGVTAAEAKEVLYQAAAYLGIGRVYPFFRAANEVLAARGEGEALCGRATTNPENRLERGEQTQVEIFGEGMRGFASSGPAETRHINRWLSANCFGDYYTRKGLSYRQREMITFCFLAAQGGCEPQLTSHSAANMRIGNDKAFLIKVVSQCLPYIGYPRSLNALRCIEQAAAMQK